MPRLNNIAKSHPPSTLWHPYRQLSPRLGFCNRSANCAMVMFWQVKIAGSGAAPAGGSLNLVNVRPAGLAFCIFGFVATSEYADTGLSSVWLSSGTGPLTMRAASAPRPACPGQVLTVPADGALATMSNRSVSAHFGMPVTCSGIDGQKSFAFESTSNKETHHHPRHIHPGSRLTRNLPPRPPGSDGLTLATSNSVGRGMVGSASETAGRLSVGFSLTLSTTITGVGIRLSSSFKPSCFSIASKGRDPPHPRRRPLGPHEPYRPLNVKVPVALSVRSGPKLRIPTNICPHHAAPSPACKCRHRHVAAHIVNGHSGSEGDRWSSAHSRQPIMILGPRLDGGPGGGLPGRFTRFPPCHPPP